MTPRDIPAALWLALVLAVLPWLSIAQAKKVARMAAARPTQAAARPTHAAARPTHAAASPRLHIYRLSMMSLAQLLLITLLIDWIDRWATVRKSLVFPRGGILWVVGCVAAHQLISLTTMIVRRLRGTPLEAGTVRLLPRDAREYAGFALLSLMAGISEEFLYRGFAPDHLVRWGLPLWLAVGLATVSFGFAHGYKSLVGMLRTMLFGLVTAAPVIVTGTLLPSIIAHALCDLLAGANTLRLARRLGVAIPETEAAPVPAGS